MVISENSGQFLNNKRSNVAVRKNFEGGGIRLLDSCHRWNKIPFKGSRIYSLLSIGVIHLAEGWTKMGIGVGWFDDINFGSAKATKIDTFCGTFRITCINQSITYEGNHDQDGP